MLSLTLLFFFCITLNAKLAPLLVDSSRPDDLIPGSYIVIFKDDVEPHVAERQLLKASTMSPVRHTFRHATKGFAAKLSQESLLSWRQNPFVEYVEQDRVVRAVSNNKSETTCTEQASNCWGQTRVAQVALNLDGSYAASAKAGAGVTAYIVDTGIYLAHSEFEGRATFGFKAESDWSDTDANGHGTHVASTVGGKTYGIAKAVDLVAVKVLGDDGSGSTAGVIAGIDYVAQQHQARGKPSTANLSLGGGFSSALNRAVQNAVNAGVVFVVAAGNEDDDACDYSPASSSAAITVGATDIGDLNGVELDVRSVFSNYGECVDIFAPGSLITAAWIGGPTKLATISGTSMACPHVCGLASLFLADAPASSPADIRHQLLQLSTKDVIRMECSNSACQASPNRLAYNGC